MQAKNVFAHPATNDRSEADQAAAHQAWTVLCAKAGHPDAANVRASGSAGEMKAARKTVRSAIKAIDAATTPGGFDAQFSSALDHGAQLISNLDRMIDGLDRKADQQVPQMKAMRSKSDFEKHYNSKEGARFTESGENLEGATIADFMRGVAKMKTTSAISNALSVGTDTAGGFVVPSVLMPGILSALAPVSSLLRAGAGIVPLEEGAKSFTTAAVSSIPTAAWREESGNVAESDPAFRAVVAVPKSLAFRFKISRELLADGKNIVEALYLVIAQAFAKELDRVGLRGTGVSPQPRGILNTVGIQAPITNGANGASLGTLRYSPLFAAAQAILQSNAPMPTAAIMSVRSQMQLAQLADTTSQPLQLPPFLKDMQLIGTSQIPDNLTIGTSTDCSEIYVGDFSNLFFMMRENVSIQQLTELYAGTGEIGFVAHVRADVMLSYPAAFAVVTGVRA